MDRATVQALRDTKQLLDDGIITEADFEAKKAELLGQPAAEPGTRGLDGPQFCASALSANSSKAARAGTVPQ